MEHNSSKSNENAARLVGQKLVAMCREGKNLEAVKELYADDIVSIEAVGNEQMPRTMHGKRAVIEKGTWWEQNHEVHAGQVMGPFPHGDDRFALVFDFDVTFKPASKRHKLQEVAVYQVADGKIVREEFFYDMA